MTLRQSSLNPYPSLPLSLAADASPYRMGALISQQYPNGLEQPIAFASRTLASSGKNYPQIEKEALALVFGVNVSISTYMVRSFVSSLTTSP